MPALPLETAGAYVAAAYLVLGLVLTYVAIMAGRLTRIDRQITEIVDILDRRDALTPATDAAPHRARSNASPVPGPSRIAGPEDSP